MSAAPVFPADRPRRPAERRRPAARGRRRPAKGISEAKRVGAVLAVYSALFTVSTGVTFGASTLLGQSMKENARRDSVRSVGRARTARAEVARLRDKVELLTTMKAVDDWSLARGFVAPYQALPKVAQPLKAIVAKAQGAKFDVTVTVARANDAAENR